MIFPVHTQKLLSVDRMTNTQIIDRFNINYEIHIMFHSLSRHSCFAPLVLPDHNCFSSPCLALNCSRIHLSHSFFLLPWNISKITPQLYTHSPSIQTLCIFIPQYIIIYGNHHHNYTRVQIDLCTIQQLAQRLAHV